MAMKTKRTIILGISGSIAAYKAVDIASQLVKAGHTVHCVLTREAAHFITPLTLETISRQPVVVDLFAERAWCPTHIAIADSADALLVAPATANIIAKMALGIADDALSTVALALRPEAKILVAPAMNSKMWLHPATQANVKTLQKRGVEFIGPDKGQLACGYEGIGRLWPVDKIVERVLKLLK